MKKLLEIWNNSLVIIGLLGLMALCLSYFVTPSEALQVYCVITSTVSSAFLCFFCYMLLLKGCSRTIPVLLVFLGSGGLSVELVSQFLTNQISSRIPLYHVSIVLLTIGIISFLNNYLIKNVNNTRGKV